MCSSTVTATISRPVAPSSRPVSRSMTTTACGPSVDEARVEQVAGEHAEQAVAELLVVDQHAARWGSSSHACERAVEHGQPLRPFVVAPERARARTAMPASSYACRLCGESRSESTCVKPCPISQISSSWRRTLRWLRANPPGRSDAASRSLMTQQNNRGSRPCAQRPRNGRHQSSPSSGGSCHRGRAIDRSTAAAAPRARDVVHTHHRGALVDRPHHGGEGAVVTRVARPRHRADEPMNALRDVPTSTGTSTRSTSSGSRASRTRLCCAVLPKPMPGSAISASRSNAARRAQPRGARRGSRRPRRRHRRSAGACCIVRGSPCMCIATKPAPASATTREHARVGAAGRDVVHDRRARFDAPPSATAALVVSTLMGTEVVGGQRGDDRDHACQLVGVGTPARRRGGSTRRRRRAGRHPRPTRSSPCRTAASGSR